MTMMMIYILLIKNTIKNFIPGPEFFFKGIYLNGIYSAFIYSREPGYSLEVILNISALYYNIDYFNGYTFVNIIQKRLDSDYNINTDLITNEFIKINDGRLAFITTEGKIDSKPKQLSIILIDISGEDYSDVIEKKYYYNLGDYYLQKEIAAFVYNGFLLFSCTYNKGDSDVFNSFLIFFGYVYGIDETIDIYPYFNDVSTFSTEIDKNIYTYLRNKMHLENNIFEFEPIEEIKLVSIPSQISFYIMTNSNEQGSLITSNSNFSVRHILKQNLELINENQYYNLEYQYIVRENSTTSKLYYGRTNRLTFNLTKSVNSEI